MSGPKYADYILERRVLLQIQSALEADIEKNKCTQLTKQINKCIETSNKLISTLNIDKYEINIAEAEKIISNSPLVLEVRKIIGEIKSEIIVSYDVTGDSRNLTSVLSAYEERLQKLKNLIFCIRPLMRELNEQYNEQNQANLETRFENTEWNAPIITSNTSEEIMRVYSNIIEQLIGYVDFEHEKNKYDNIMNDHSIDDNFKISQMKMKYESFLVEKQSDDDNLKILGLRSDFAALSNLLYGECIKIPDNVDELEKSVAEMLKEISLQRNGDYVAACVDKVMKDLGYNVVGNEVLSAQKMKKQHFDYSEDSAITVASSDNGAIMLEVVGKKNDDGTDGSAHAVKSDMEKFCPDYKKIKDGLKQYGITLNDKKLCPPDEKYVRFIDVTKTKSSDRRIEARDRKKRMYDE